jgi:hypothetical protein
MIQWYHLNKETEEKLIKSIQMVLFRRYCLLPSEEDVNCILKEIEKDIHTSEWLNGG